jgi:AraC-like DNA-binding protein
MIMKRRQLHAWGQPIAAMGVELYTCGEITKTGPDWISEGRALNYALIFIKNGTGIFSRMAGQESRVKEGDIFILFPGSWYRYGPGEGERWEEYWINMNGPTIRSLEQHGSLRHSLPLVHPARGDRIEQRIDRFMTDLMEPANRERLCGEAFGILTDIFASPLEWSSVPSASAVANIAEQVKKEYAREWDFEAAARREGMSYSLLRKRFAELYGMAPRRFLIAQRMRVASILLTHGLSAKETCFRVGMNDPYAFSKTFKREFGLSPRHYRKRLEKTRESHELLEQA